VLSIAGIRTSERTGKYRNRIAIGCDSGATGRFLRATLTSLISADSSTRPRIVRGSINPAEADFRTYAASDAAARFRPSRGRIASLGRTASDRVRPRGATITDPSLSLPSSLNPLPRNIVIL